MTARGNRAPIAIAAACKAGVGNTKVTGGDQFLLSVQDLITIYAALLDSINTIWNV